MYRKGVVAIILNNQNQILLVNLTNFEENFYSIPGGGSEKGESSTDTLKREIFEELGIEPNKISIIKKSNTIYKFNFQVPTIKDGKEYIGQEKECFLVKFKGIESDIKLSKNEVRKYLWSDYKNLYEYLLFEEQLDSIQTFIKELCPQIL